MTIELTTPGTNVNDPGNYSLSPEIPTLNPNLTSATFPFGYDESNLLPNDLIAQPGAFDYLDLLATLPTDPPAFGSTSGSGVASVGTTGNPAVDVATQSILDSKFKVSQGLFQANTAYASGGVDAAAAALQPAIDSLNALYKSPTATSDVQEYALAEMERLNKRLESLNATSSAGLVQKRDNSNLYLGLGALIFSYWQSQRQMSFQQQQYERSLDAQRQFSAEAHQYTLAEIGAQTEGAIAQIDASAAAKKGLAGPALTRGQSPRLN
jgi:hypothetical protein